jgi:hypothetical protein
VYVFLCVFVCACVCVLALCVCMCVCLLCVYLLCACVRACRMCVRVYGRVYACVPVLSHASSTDSFKPNASRVPFVPTLSKPCELFAL